MYIVWSFLFGEWQCSDPMEEYAAESVVRSLSAGGVHAYCEPL